MSSNVGLNQLSISVGSSYQLLIDFLNYYADGRKYTCKEEERSTHKVICGKLHVIISSYMELCNKTNDKIKYDMSKNFIKPESKDYIDTLKESGKTYFQLSSHKDFDLAILKAIDLIHKIANYSFSLDDRYKGLWSDSHHAVVIGKGFHSACSTFNKIKDNYVIGEGPSMYELAPLSILNRIVSNHAGDAEDLLNELVHSMTRIETSVRNKKLGRDLKTKAEIEHQHNKNIENVLK